MRLPACDPSPCSGRPGCPPTPATCRSHASSERPPKSLSKRGGGGGAASLAISSPRAGEPQTLHGQDDEQGDEGEDGDVAQLGFHRAAPTALNNSRGTRPTTERNNTGGVNTHRARREDRSVGISAARGRDNGKGSLGRPDVMRCKPPVEPGRRLNRRLDYARQLGTKLLVRHLPRAIRPGTGPNPTSRSAIRPQSCGPDCSRCAKSG
jgi:hypothetical protein